MGLQEADAMLAKMIHDLHRMDNDREAEAAAKDPEKHKLSRVFTGGAKFRYYTGGKNKKSQRIYHCFTTNKNVAGYHLYFREVHYASGKTVKRDSHKAFKSEGAADTFAYRKVLKKKPRHEAPGQVKGEDSKAV